MPRIMKPLAVKELEGRRYDKTRAKQSGQGEAQAIQRKSMDILDAGQDMGDWGRMRASSEFYAKFVREFEAIPFYYRVDFASLGLASDALERYHAYMDEWRQADPEERRELEKAISKAASSFAHYAGRLGLDPASRDKFLTNSSIRNALMATGTEEVFEWDE